MKQLLLQQEKKDVEIVAEMFEEARTISDQATAESYVQSFGKFAVELMAQLKSPLVKNREGKEVHKKKVASILNQGLSLRKSSTDRDKCVKELLTRHSGGKSSDSPLVANALEFGRQEVGKRSERVWLFF